MESGPRPVTRRPRPPRTSTAGSLALVLFGLLVALGALVAVGVVGAYVSLTRDLDDPSELFAIRPIEESIVYDRTGQTELARFGQVQREIVEFEDIPPIVVDATTAVEDKSFWTNPGFDPAAIVAAGIDAIRGNPRGASTITQQLVRARLLDADLVQAEGRQIERKLLEIIQSIRLTQEYGGEDGKQDIIAAYLNLNFYGNNSYGVKAAARNYFDKDLAELTLAEAAILAGIPQSPSRFDLVRNAVQEDDGTLVVPPDTEIVERRNFILDLLAEGRTPLSGDEFSAEDFERAKREPVELSLQEADNWTAPHFVWAVREELTRHLCGEETQTCDELEQGGYRITTTIDLRLQEIAEKWVKAATLVPKADDPEAMAEDLGLEFEPWMANLTDKNIHNGALVAMDYQTGELVAYVGSADYYAEEGSPQFQPKFDVAGDGYRQPGSSFKPFNYLAGIDQRTFTAASMFMDVGTDFGGGYTPNNADLRERGPLRLRQALQFSLNIPSVKAAIVNGPDFVFQKAREYGMVFADDVLDGGASIALGVEEVRPVDLVTAYGMLANQGRLTGHTTIIRITTAAGEDVGFARPEPQQVASPEATSIISDILGGNTAPSINPFWSRFRIMEGEERRPAALKTGTNNDARDLNAYGYLGPPTDAGRQAGEYALTVGVWNGNSDNTEASTPQNPIFSIEVTTFVWQGFLTEASAGWAINPLTRAEGLVGERVDPWTGLLPAPGDEGVSELFIPGTQPTRSVGGVDGICGEAILREVGFEARYENWMAADRDWLARARRGPGTVGGPDGTRVSYFYNDSFNPYGRSWGPLFRGDCGSPEPTPSCFPIPTPDASGVVPSFAIPSPEGSGVAPLPCPTPSAAPSESASPSPSLEPTEPPPTEPPPTEPPPTDRPTPDPGPPTPEPTPEPEPTPAPSANVEGSPPP
jgi:membrane peptidoglycan carboxypeptidase